MRKFATILVSCLLTVTALGAYAPSAYANHAYSLFLATGLGPSDPNWIDFVSPCILGRNRPLRYPASTLFFVVSGWGYLPWTPALPEERAPFMSHATRFDFLVDGQLQQQARSFFYSVEGGEIFGIVQIQPDSMGKLFTSENHDGLTGSHLFTGRFYLDASFLGGSFGDAVLLLECNTTVNFK